MNPRPQIFIQSHPFLSTNQFMHPCMCQLEDGSIILVHILENDGEANIRILRSEDDGTTWDVVSREDGKKLFLLESSPALESIHMKLSVCVSSPSRGPWCFW